MKATTNAKDSLTNEAMIVYKKIVVTDREIPPQPFENPGISFDETLAKYNSFWVNKEDANFFVHNMAYNIGSYYWGDTDP